ncbi:hypothetical protein OAK61_01395 [Gammaproteobacteria bacterium]|nr:hypothetical protein [Gammaproteobacteria bacterium]
MKNWLTIAMMLFVITPAFAGGHKNDGQIINKDGQIMNKTECSETKEGIAELLMVADYFWKELEKDSENKELYGAIAFYSQQAANYSTIYDVWCD